MSAAIVSAGYEVVDIVNGTHAEVAVCRKSHWYYVLRRLGKFWDCISAPYSSYEAALDFALDASEGN